MTQTQNQKYFTSSYTSIFKSIVRVNVDEYTTRLLTMDDGHQFNNNNKTLNILCCEQDPKRPQSSRHAKPQPVGQKKGHETVRNKIYVWTQVNWIPLHEQAQ